MLAARCSPPWLRSTPPRPVCCARSPRAAVMASRSHHQELGKGAGPQVVTVSATSSGSGGSAAVAPGPVLLQVRWWGCL